MAEFTIYSKPDCSFCDKAKYLLMANGLTYEELVLDMGQVKEDGVQYYTVQELKELVPNARTVPQIFRNNNLLGGFEALRTSLQ